MIDNDVNNLIAVVGKMHSGKTTFAEHLIQQYRYKRFSFAQPLKEVSALMLTLFTDFLDQRLERNRIAEVDGAYTVSDLNKIKGHPSIRKLLQLVGTELGRDWYGPDTVWIDLLKHAVELEQQQLKPVKIVVDDCRFLNEAEALRELGFYIIRVDRESDERVESVTNALLAQGMNFEEAQQELKKILNHPSETELDLIAPDAIALCHSTREVRQAADRLAFPVFA